MCRSRVTLLLTVATCNLKDSTSSVEWWETAPNQGEMQPTSHTIFRGLHQKSSPQWHPKHCNYMSLPSGLMTQTLICPRTSPHQRRCVKTYRQLVTPSSSPTSETPLKVGSSWTSQPFFMMCMAPCSEGPRARSTSSVSSTAASWPSCFLSGMLRWSKRFSPAWSSASGLTLC